MLPSIQDACHIAPVPTVRCLVGLRGKISQWQSTEVKATFRRNNKKTDTCGWKEMCYCGSTKACPIGNIIRL